MVEPTPRRVWYYLALFLIGCLFFIFLAFKSYHMVNSSTTQYLLWVVGLRCQLKLNVNLNLFTTKPKVCLVKYITTVSWYYSDHILLESCVSRNAYRCIALSEATIESVLDFPNFTGKPAPLSLQLHSKEIPTQVFSCKICNFFFKISILKNTCERLLLENTYSNIYALLNTSS